MALAEDELAPVAANGPEGGAPGMVVMIMMAAEAEWVYERVGILPPT